MLPLRTLREVSERRCLNSVSSIAACPGIKTTLQAPGRECCRPIAHTVGQSCLGDPVRASTCRVVVHPGSVFTYYCPTVSDPDSTTPDVRRFHYSNPLASPQSPVANKPELEGAFSHIKSGQGYDHGFEPRIPVLSVRKCKLPISGFIQVRPVDNDLFTGTLGSTPCFAVVRDIAAPACLDSRPSIDTV